MTAIPDTFPTEKILGFLTWKSKMRIVFLSKKDLYF